MFRPSYLAIGGARPTLADATIGTPANPLRWVAGRTYTVLVNTTVALDAVRGVAFLAVAAQTHSYDQNQRYTRGLNIQLGALVAQQQSVTFSVPECPVIVPGVHHLFLLTSGGLPSVARHLVVSMS